MSEDEQRVQVQIALWQMLEAEGMKPTTDLVRRIRKLVEDGLKDRDVVLEEAVRKAEDNAWQEARELVRGTNADMCKTAWRAYQIIHEGMTDAVNNRDLRTLEGRVDARLKGRG